MTSVFVSRVLLGDTINLSVTYMHIHTDTDRPMYKHIFTNPKTRQRFIFNESLYL